MVMAVSQVRLPQGLENELDLLVKRGLYASKSDALRDAVRGLVWKHMVGIIPNKGDSVKEIRDIRKRLSKEKFDLDKINKLAD